MSKYKVIDIWNQLYGNEEAIVDYAGREMRKSACSNPRSAYQPTIDHIRPLSNGGKDTLDNIIICNRVTNEEKGDFFPHWVTNNHRFKAKRVKGNKKACAIYYNN